MRRFALLLSFVALAAKAERLPMQSDFGRCANAMQNSGHDADLQGQLRMEILVRKDGRVYAAFIAGERGISNRKLERCLVNEALLWQINNPPPPIDYQKTYGWISFAPAFGDSGGDTDRMGVGSAQTLASVMMPDINNPPPWEPIAVDVAQQTLDIAEFATLAEKGTADLAVKLYPDAIKAFRDALAKNAEDQMALRGLSQALVESGGDLNEARLLAERLLKIAPASVGGHEAMIRVCVAQKDATCLLQNWKPALSAPDFGVRSRLFKEQLQTPVQQTLAEAQKTAPVRQAAEQPQDECAAAQGDEAMALCLVKRCLDAGSAQYAKELSEQNKVEYVAGDWRAKPVGGAKLLVTRDIATKGVPPEQHNPMWLVKLGEQVTMQPTNAEARQITLTHNACAARVNAGK